MTKNEKMVSLYFLCMTMLPIPIALLLEFVCALIGKFTKNEYGSIESIKTYTFIVVYTVLGWVAYRLYNDVFKCDYNKSTKKLILLSVFFFGILLGFVNYGTSEMFQLLGLLTTENQEDIKSVLATNFLISAIPIGIIAPIVEEIIFRYIFQNWFKRFGVTVSIVIPSLLFGLWHYSGGPALSIVPYFIIGTFLGIVYHKTDNIVIIAGAHVFNNIGILLGALALALFDTVIH